MPRYSTPISVFVKNAGLILAVSAMSLLAAPKPARAADLPEFTSGNGIKVLKTAWLEGSDRTIIVDIETPLISPNAINGGVNQVWITLPETYFSTSPAKTGYPVLYLLHGGAGGWSGQWVVGGGTAEWSTKGKDLITVMPDCGKVGWFTDWVNNSDGAQKWESFHLTQLIPWIDANLRTNPRKEGRAIAGLSMGGYGAFHYASKRPDLFAYAASYSGAVDLENSGTQLVIYEQSLQSGFSGNGAFGPTDSANWAKQNPLNYIENLRKVQLALYVGGGIHAFDVLEGTMRASASSMHNALDKANIKHFFWMYGRPGDGCDGGHNFGCWNFAFNDDLPKIMEALAPAKEEGAGDHWWQNILPWKAGLPGADALKIDLPVEVNWDGRAK